MLNTLKKNHIAQPKDIQFFSIIPQKSWRKKYWETSKEVPTVVQARDKRYLGKGVAEIDL